VWRDNTAEEALLGVSLTGILDHPVLGNHKDESLPKLLEKLREEAIKTNAEWASKLGINHFVLIIFVKPLVTVSQLVDSASGIHGRFAHHYIRRVRADIKDPLCNVLKEAGVPWEVDYNNPNVLVFSFYKEAPKNSIIASDQTGIEQLELWSVYQEHWCEHKPSITVYYRDSDFLEIGNWLWKNFDSCSGVSFLPYDGGTYQQAPYEKITEEEYLKGKATLPETIDWSITEASDTTVGQQTLACTGGACEI